LTNNNLPLQPQSAETSTTIAFKMKFTMITLIQAMAIPMAMASAISMPKAHGGQFNIETSVHSNGLVAR